MIRDPSAIGRRAADRIAHRGRPKAAALVETLEPRCLLSATVVARYIFYGNSVWSGRGLDASIAPDKTALLPGQTATFTNYTSYDKGINGIAIDAKDWAGVPNADDFIFYSGNTSDTSQWTQYKVWPTISEKRGGGVNGTDRIYISWPDNSLRNQWLQVNVRAMKDTGLTTPDVFYFGNAVGESGNSSSNAEVNGLDEFGARLHPRTAFNPTTIIDPYDFNRDGRVDATDQLIARNNGTTADSALQLVTVPPEPEPLWDLDTFFRMVQPMQHGLQGRMPLLYWGMPLYAGFYTAMQQAGALAPAIAGLAARGFVPQVRLDPSISDSVVLAKALQDAGQPVYLLIPQNDLVLSTAYANCPVWVTGPDDNKNGALGSWPAWPLADPAPGAARVSSLLAPIAAAGIDVAGVFFDDEAGPAPWNGVWQADANSPAARAVFPPGTLDTYDHYNEYVYSLATQLDQQIMFDPVHALWPTAKVANFDMVQSGATTPFVATNGVIFPQITLPPGAAEMPMAYADDWNLLKIFNPATFTQPVSDGFYLHSLLASVTTAQVNRAPGMMDIPYVSAFAESHANVVDPRLQLGMSSGAYKELLRHLWLRGVDGMFLFTFGRSVVPSFQQVEAARSVYDEMLQYPGFLQNGTPLNLTLPTVSGAPIWSGLRWGNQALIRTYPDGPADTTVTLSPFAGITVTLPAPAGGATYIVNSDGTFNLAGAAASLARSQRPLSNAGESSVPAVPAASVPVSSALQPPATQTVAKRPKLVRRLLARVRPPASGRRPTAATS